MPTQIPTRITFEFLAPADPTAGGAGAPIVNVVPSAAAPVVAAVAAEPRETPVLPAAYIPEPCTCPDGGCAADHTN